MALEQGPGLQPSGLSDLSDLPSKRTHYSPHCPIDQNAVASVSPQGNVGHLWGSLPQRPILVSQARCLGHGEGAGGLKGSVLGGKNHVTAPSGGKNQGKAWAA